MAMTQRKLHWVDLGWLALTCLFLLYMTAHALAQPATTTPTIRCTYNSSPPSVPSGNSVYVQCDASGHLLTSGSISIGAVTIADGADVAEGSRADAAWSSGNGTTISLLKKIAGNTASGGGAVTLASGAVASGAYSAGSLAAGAGVDGWNLTAGTKADATWSGSGSGSEIAILKKIATSGGSVAITSPLGTNAIAASVAVTPATSSTWPISASALPLPALAATSTKQSDGSQKTQIVDGSGSVIASTSNNLNVQCANCSGSGASAVDGATFTAGSSVFAPLGGAYQTTATANPLTNGKQGLAQLTAQRALFVNLRDSSGNEEGLSGQPLRTFDTTVNTTLAGLAVPVPLTVVVAPYSYTPLAGAQYNLAIVASTALTVPGAATIAKICAKTATVNYTTDGATTPTSSIGIPLDIGSASCITLSGATVLSNFRALSATGTLSVEYFN